MDYGLVMLMSMAIFLLINAAPLIGAWQLAGKLAENNFTRWSLAGFIFLLESCLIFSLLGALGVLNLQGSIIGAAAIGLSVIAAAHAVKLPSKSLPQASASITYAERLLEAATGILILLVCIKSAYLLGTDTMLYHLYYPAMWIDAGKIFAIPMQGLPHEYFPICGEALYGWLMFGGVEAPLVCLLQPAAAGMALLAMAGLWKNFNIPNIYIKAAALLTAASGIIIENASMCYTDTLAGALLLTGICYLIEGIFIRRQLGLGAYVFTALGAVAMGLCAAVKYSGLVLAPVITLLLIIFFIFYDVKQKEFTKRWKNYLTAIICAIISAGVFYLPNYLKTGNPFYPVKIPFLFSNGVEFERSTVEFTAIKDLFVNNSAWSMSVCSALFFLLLPLATLFAAWKNRCKDTKLAQLLTALTVILVLSEIIMLLIYPAATQARQVIPYLMALSTLLAPALYYLLPQLAENGKKSVFIASAILFFCFFTASSHYHIKYSMLALGVSAAAYILAFFNRPKARFAVNTILAAAAAFMLFFCWYIRWAATDMLLNERTAPAIARGINTMRSTYKQSRKPLKTAACGTWFNYYMMLDMPGSQVHCVPVNAENTLSVHKVSEVKNLREPVEYAVWFERLKKGGYTHLVIQLDSHQDYGANRDLELKWALEHPENFILFSNDKNNYFFIIKY